MTFSDDEDPGVSTGKLRLRATLLSAWSVTPDAAFRQAIERELYGEPAPERAAEEWERLKMLDRTGDDYSFEADS